MYFNLVVMIIIMAGTFVLICIMANMAWKHIKILKKDKAAPLLVVEAMIVEKRSVLIKRFKSSSESRLYAIFEFENGDRQEFIVGKFEWHGYEQGYVGRLTFKGTIYKSFECIN